MKATLVFLAISFVADQLLQAKSVRQSKHKSTVSLFLHVLTWSIPMFMYAAMVMIKTGQAEVMIWWFAISVIHFAVEWCCIRMWTHYYYDRSRSYMVFWILLEQFIINVSMIWLFEYLMR